MQFTGNTEIIPILSEATDLGLLGLIWISLIKVLAIAWSHVMGYRGGLVFPLVFVATSVVAIATLQTSEFNIILSIFLFLAGALYADRESKIITSEE